MNKREKLPDESVNITKFVNKLLLIQKIKLYDACLGKRAHDGGLFHWNYTEWYYWCRMQCSFNTNDRRIISANNDSNPSYQTYYAPPSTAARLFSNELTVFFPCMGLKMEPDIDPHKIIIFRKESSEILFNMGLHLCAEEDIKKLLKARIGHRFFVEASKSGDLHQGLLPEIIKLIYAIRYGFVNARQLISDTEVNQIDYTVSTLRM